MLIDGEINLTIASHSVTYIINTRHLVGDVLIFQQLRGVGIKLEGKATMPITLEKSRQAVAINGDDNLITLFHIACHLAAKLGGGMLAFGQVEDIIP